MHSSEGIDIMLKWLIILALFLPLSARAEEISEGARQFLAHQPKALARGDGAVSTAYGVSVTQDDIDLRGYVDICNVRKGDVTHSPDLSFWPELAPSAPPNQPPGPCARINQKYEQSGAKAKFLQSDANLRSDQYLAIMKAAGKQ
jgi:hypothetical protein